MGRHIATPAEIASELGISERTLLDLRNSGRGFPWVQISRQRWGVPWAAFDAWLLSQAADHATNGTNGTAA